MIFLLILIVFFRSFILFFFFFFADLFAIPDFAAGAMENWGLITYRETAVLYDSATDSSANKQRVAMVIAHELAHQVGRSVSLLLCFVEIISAASKS